MRSVIHVFLIVVAGLGLGATAAAQAPETPAGVALNAAQDVTTGWVGLTLAAPAGSVVTLSEGGQAFTTVTLTGGSLQLPRALAWRCDRHARRIDAAASAPDGTHSTAEVSVRTPGCANRFVVRVSPRTAARVGHRLRVTVRDSWRTGMTNANVCLRVRAASVCRLVQVPRSAAGVTVQLAVKRSGLGDVRVIGAGFAVDRRLQIRARDEPLRVLATGDSMIQIIDSLLARRLEGHHEGSVTSDARISTGISKPFMFDWVRHAKGAAARVRPQVTVMFIGANDGFPIGKINCCGADWIEAYAQRVKTMMSAYRRGGAGRVYWLTIPEPRDRQRKPIYDAINQAIERAAASFAPTEVSVIDLVPIFTPGGVFRSSINGRVVRQADGIHLNVAGAKIAAGVILRRLRADGLTR